jgi:lipopolysaccharide/colanic/teichoic acid biosynthesis glycosyltransferase
MTEANSAFPFSGERSRQDGFAGTLKRICDLAAGLLLLALVWPLLLLLALAIRITMGSPVLFRQRRPGFREKIFTIYKFRTMSEERDAQGRLLPDEQRLAGAGKIIRNLSLDELPQLFNVIKGDLSLVGPRPLLIEYLDRYEPEQRKRHLVRPGITGWAQINGRNAITWEQKFAYDIYYVEHWSLVRDLKILAMTVWKVLKREGISQPGEATMEKFKGSRIR